MKTKIILALAALTLVGVACTAPEADTLNVKSFDGATTEETIPATNPEPVAAPSTCDVAREAFLTGNAADIKTALEAMIADTTADATAREYAQTYLSELTDDYSWAGDDAETMRKSSLESSVSLIRMSCAY
jgi:hypothetical protein